MSLPRISRSVSNPEPHRIDGMRLSDVLNLMEFDLANDLEVVKSPNASIVVEPSSSVCQIELAKDVSPRRGKYEARKALWESRGKPQQPQRAPVGNRFANMFRDNSRCGNFVKRPQAMGVKKCKPCKAEPFKMPTIIVCREYLQGCCDKGSNCKFLHDPSVFKPDTQKVFMGGFPKFMRDLSPEQLIGEFKALGYNIINTPMMHPKGFIAKVTLASVEEAQRMVQNKVVEFSGFKQQRNVKIDVRPYSDKKGDTAEHRSLIIENLPRNMTPKTLKSELEKLGWLVKNAGQIENGVALKCEMLTVDAADSCTTLGNLPLGGTTVTIRAFRGQKSRYWNKKSTMNNKSHKSANSSGLSSPAPEGSNTERIRRFINSRKVY